MHADLLLTHGTFYTVDPARPRAEAVAVAGERILAVGDRAELAAWTGPDTRVLDLEGGFVLPGLFDSHVHFIQGGRSLLSVQLRSAATPAEFTARIAAHAAQLPEGEWIVEGNWDHQRFPGAELPRREWIDAATPRHPVCVARLDGHMVLCNSLALERVGIGRDTLTPEGGEIQRDPATGELTGILKDAAADLVFRAIPPAGPALARRYAEEALREAAARGVTSVHDVSAEVGFRAYQELLREGRLTARITGYVPLPRVAEVNRIGLQSGFGNARLRFGGLKGFVDGALGSGTACFFEPYADEPDNRGLFYSEMFPEGAMLDRVRSAERAGTQVAVHAIGDRAIAALLDIYETVAREAGPRDRRFRVEHAQHPRPADLARFRALGAIASVQPYQAVDDGCWAGDRIGAGRLSGAFPFHSFLAAGVPMAFGSDWPVAPMDPILAIHAAVTRRTLDGRHPDGWVPEQKISLEAAIQASTLGGAYAEGAEREKGSITPGKLADFTVLDRNLFDLAPERLDEAAVAMTLCGGAVVYRR